MQGAANVEAAATGTMAPVQTTIMKAAKGLGTEAEEDAVRRAAEVVVVEAMQVEGMEAARAKIANAVQQMGWHAAEAAIMEAVQIVVQEERELASRVYRERTWTMYVWRSFKGSAQCGDRSAYGSGT